MTNREKIQSMKSDELSVFLHWISDCCCGFGRSQEHFDEDSAKECCSDCPIGYSGKGGCDDEDIERWLDEEAEEDAGTD